MAGLYCRPCRSHVVYQWIVFSGWIPPELSFLGKAYITGWPSLHVGWPTSSSSTTALDTRHSACGSMSRTNYSYPQRPVLVEHHHHTTALIFPMSPPAHDVAFPTPPTTPTTPSLPHIQFNAARARRYGFSAPTHTSGPGPSRISVRSKRPTVQNSAEHSISSSSRTQSQKGTFAPHPLLRRTRSSPAPTAAVTSRPTKSEGEAVIKRTLSSSVVEPVVSLEGYGGTWGIESGSGARASRPKVVEGVSTLSSKSSRPYS